MSLIALEGDCTIARIAEIHRTLSDAFSAGARRIDLDLGAILAADVTFVQLLASAAASAARSGTALRVSSVPSEIQALFERAGLRLDAELGRVSPL